MTLKQRRATYRHGNVRAEAIAAGYELVSRRGHQALSLRQVAEQVGVAHRSLYNHFTDREALLDAIATEAHTRLGGMVAKAGNAEEYVAAYVRFALADAAMFALMISRPHGTMKHNPPLQSAVHLVLTEAMRIFCADLDDKAPRRRRVMKVYMILYAGISLYSAGILDQPSEDALIAELSAMLEHL